MNLKLSQRVSGRISLVNGQDQIVYSGNNCYSGAFVDEEKNSQQNIFMTLLKTVCPNRIDLHVGKQGVGSAEIGALVPVFDKSATELIPKLLTSKNI